jgi:hypothetical protein
MRLFNNSYFFRRHSRQSLNRGAHAPSRAVFGALAEHICIPYRASLLSSSKILPLLFALFVSFVTSCKSVSLAQEIKPEWVRTYSWDVSRTNQALTIGIATNGNIVVCGTSINSSGNADYLAIAYRPNGDEAWRYRYASGPATENFLRATSVAPNGLTALTGTTDTIALDPNGGMLWSKPYSGRAVATDSEYVYVTGFSETDFATAKLGSVDGTDVWTKIYDQKALPNISTAISVGGAGDVLVAGTETYVSDRTGFYLQFGLVKYSSGGTEMWHASAGRVPMLALPPVVGVGLDSAGRSALLFNEVPTQVSYSTYWYDSTGTVKVVSGLDTYSGQSYGGFSDRNGYSYMTGSTRRPGFPCTTVKRDPNGMQLWLADLTADGINEIRGTAVAADSNNQTYVAGFSPRLPTEGTDNDIFVAKYDKDGRQLWLHRYDSPQHGNDIPVGIVVDGNQNVYVTGYSTTPEGGTEFLTLKYSASPKIEKKADGAMHLEFHTNPGQQFAIEASADFLSWLGLSTNVADANGLFQFDDTQATNYPSRFYRGNPVQ